MFAISSVTESVEEALHLNPRYLSILVESTPRNWMLFVVDHFSSDSWNAIAYI